MNRACSLHPGQGAQSLNTFLGAIYSLGDIKVVWVMGALADSSWSGPARAESGNWGAFCCRTLHSRPSSLTQPVQVRQGRKGRRGPSSTKGPEPWVSLWLKWA